MLDCLGVRETVVTARPLPSCPAPLPRGLAPHLAAFAGTALLVALFTSAGATRVTGFYNGSGSGSKWGVGISSPGFTVRYRD